MGVMTKQVFSNVFFTSNADPVDSHRVAIRDRTAWVQRTLDSLLGPNLVSNSDAVLHFDVVDYGSGVAYSAVVEIDSYKPDIQDR